MVADLEEQLLAARCDLEELEASARGVHRSLQVWSSTSAHVMKTLEFLHRTHFIFVMVRVDILGLRNFYVRVWVLNINNNVNLIFHMTVCVGKGVSQIVSCTFCSHVGLIRCPA